jgi:hypothetical protein
MFHVNWSKKPYPQNDIQDGTIRILIFTFRQTYQREQAGHEEAQYAADDIDPRERRIPHHKCEGDHAHHTERIDGQVDNVELLRSAMEMK